MAQTNIPGKYKANEINARIKLVGTFARLELRKNSFDKFKFSVILVGHDVVTDTRKAITRKCYFKTLLLKKCKNMSLI